MDFKESIKKLPKIQFTREKLFEEEFSKEILISERLRLTILSAFFIIVAIWIFTMPLVFRDQFSEFTIMYHGFPLRYWFSGFFILSGLYGLLVRFVFGYFIMKKKQFPKAVRYLNAFVETSIPTLAIFLASKIYQPAYALFVPTTFFYFIFIFLSSFRLSMSLCFFTGFVAFAEYLTIALVLINHPENIDVHPMLQSTAQHFGRALVLLAGGLVTGFVAFQIKRRLIRSQQNVAEKEKIIAMFGQHVSPEVVNKLLEAQTGMITEKRHVCIMFLDIRNFTGFSEGRDPEEIVDFLNFVFEFMIDVINEHNGIINKFLGDGFMAVFGAPISDGNDALNAVNASLKIAEKLEENIKAGSIPDIGIGVGLHSGMAVTGNVGSSLRKEYTIIGEIVNLAARVEKINKKFESKVIITESVYNEIDKEIYKVSDLGKVLVRGLKNPVHIYKLL